MRDKRQGSEQFSESSPCPECYGWGEYYSTCKHPHYICPTCSREQCLFHWKYPMKTEVEAVHFLKGAEVSTGNKCIIRLTPLPSGFKKYKIFPDEKAHNDYLCRLHSKSNT